MRQSLNEIYAIFLRRSIHMTSVCADDDVYIARTHLSIEIYFNACCMTRSFTHRPMRLLVGEIQ